MFTRSHAQASPSVTLEKGLARLRPVRPKAVPFARSLREKGNPGSPFPTDTERRAAAILTSVAFATLLAVCLALYLLSRSSRWELSLLPFRARSKLLSSSAPDDPFLTPLPAPRVHTKSSHGLVSKIREPSERYLSYLPHSGFHNQRIALENALVLASILDRTLLIPPVRLGDPPIRYRPFTNLRIDVALSTNIGLEHCRLVSDSAFLPDECTDFWSHAHVPWDWFVDLQSVTYQHDIRTVARWDLTDAFLARLRLMPMDTYFLNDTDPYHFRFFDSSANSTPLGERYRERVNLPALAELSREYRLLQFGTLFGTTRVRLSEPAHVALRRDIRRAMVLANAGLMAIADEVRDSRELGGMWGYAAVHLRLGDGVFADGEARARNVWHVWWKLVRALGVSDEEALKIEFRVRKGKGGKDMRTPPTQGRDAGALRAPHPPPPPLPSFTPSPACQRSASHPLLNIPLYIATDKPGHRALSLFTHTFPCVYFLSNFSSHLAQLNGISAPNNDSPPGTDNDSPLDADSEDSPFFDDTTLTSSENSIPLTPFLPPFLDAMIASKARVVIGTPGSTFSRFVEDVLWRAYHGWEIVQRG